MVQSIFQHGDLCQFMSTRGKMVDASDEQTWRNNLSEGGRIGREAVGTLDPQKRLPAGLQPQRKLHNALMGGRFQRPQDAHCAERDVQNGFLGLGGQEPRDAVIELGLGECIPRCGEHGGREKGPNGDGLGFGSSTICTIFVKLVEGGEDVGLELPERVDEDDGRLAVSPRHAQKVLVGLGQHRVGV